MTAITICNLLLLAGGFLVARLLLPPFFNILSEAGAVKKNYQGNLIPAMAGIIFPLLFSLVSLPLLFLKQPGNTLVVSLFAIYGTALLGLLDDTMGDAGPRGLKGHFSYLWQHKKISTGVIKASGTGVIALWVVFSLEPMTIERVTVVSFINWLLLVLSVNLINLLDLRPGRAVKITAFFITIAALFPLEDYKIISLTAGILLAYLPYDLQSMVMLGDSGSNCLGMIAGLILLQLPDVVKISLVLIFLLLHIVAEKLSFTRIIEGNALLRLIDRWGQK